MDQEQQTPKKIKAENIELFAYGAAAVSSLFSAWMGIRRNFYKNLREFGFLETDHAERLTKQHDLLKNHAGDIGSLIKGSAEIEREYGQKITSHIRSVGVRNVFDKFRLLKEHQKFEILVTMATVGSVALAAVLSFSRDKELSSRLDQIESNQEREEAYQRR